MRRHRRKVFWLLEFARANKASMLPVMSAFGDCGLPLFVLKGSSCRLHKSFGGALSLWKRMPTCCCAGPSLQFERKVEGYTAAAYLHGPCALHTASAISLQATALCCSCTTHTQRTCRFDRNTIQSLNMSDYYAPLRIAFEKNFTRTNIASSFLRAVLWHVDLTRLLDEPQLRDAHDLGILLATPTPI
eukprot:IDg10163t1